jgi:cytochrome c peroxidase
MTSRLQKTLWLLLGFALMGSTFASDPVPVPFDNLPDAKKAEIGEMICFDRRLSVNNSLSCMDCHKPDHGFSDTKPLSKGRLSRDGTRPDGNRKSIPLLNDAHHKPMFHDELESKGLEAQFWDAPQNPIEMGPQKPEDVAKRFLAIPGYVKLFQEAGFPITSNINDAKNVATMIVAMAACGAQFQRTLVANDTNYQHAIDGETWYESEAEKRGHALFFGKFQCSKCHNGPDLTDDKSHNIGTEFYTRNGDLTAADQGRGAITKDQADNRKFKTSRLVNCVATGPYMHNGTFPDLPTCVDFFIAGGYRKINGKLARDPLIDSLIQPIKCTTQERSDVITFLTVSLTPRDYPKIEKPKLP